MRGKSAFLLSFLRRSLLFLRRTTLTAYMHRVGGELREMREKGREGRVLTTSM